jgi:hypothetical protein
VNVPKSVFLKKTISKKNCNKPKDQKYVNDLLYIEHGILVGGALGWAGAMLYFQKKNQYPSEYEAMKLELEEKN